MGSFALLLWLIIAWSVRAASRDLRQSAQHKLSLYSQVLDSEIRRHRFLPFALVGNKDILELLGDQHNAELQERINRYLADVSQRTHATAVYLMNAEGLTLASSNWDQAGSYVGNNYSFRPYFQAALAGQLGHYFAVGATTGTPGLFLSYPAVIDGRIAGVVALKVALDPLEQNWAEQSNEKVVVSDGNGVVIASSDPNWKFHTLSPLGPERREQLRLSRQFMDYELPPLGLTPAHWLLTVGDAMQVATPPRQYAPSPFNDLGFGSCYLVQSVSLPDSDWKLHIFADMTPVARGLVNALAIFGPTALALALLIFYLLEHRFYTLERQELQRRAKAELETSEAQKRAIIQSTRAALVTIDEAGLIESLNPTAERFFGYTAEQARGLSINALLFKPAHDAIDAYLRQARSGHGGDFSLETRGRRQDGSAFFIDLLISDLFSQQGYRFLITIHNLTKRKAAEEELRHTLDAQEERIRERTAALQTSNERLQREIAERRRAEEVLRETQNDLIQASKLAALGQLSAGIAHELNQPLAAIRTFSASGKLLLERGLYDQAATNFGRIQELTERMAKLTSQLKTFARKSSGKAVPVSVHTAVYQALDLVEQLASLEGVEVSVELPEQDIQVLADQLRLEQVLINLFSNAVDAMKNAGERRLHVTARVVGQKVWLAVADSGGGIAETILPQIFDPFFTTKEVGEGLGLGLSISYGIVRDWGGTLKARNTGEGAEFTLELPHCRNGEEAEA